MCREESHQAALEAAAQTTRARIRRDRAQAPASLRNVFTAVSRWVFELSFNATAAWRFAGITDYGQRRVFKQATGSHLIHYIAAARIEVAHILMLTTDLKLPTISLLVGYTHHRTFIKNYKRIHCKPPYAVERKPPPSPPRIDDETAREAIRGLLSEDEIDRFLAALLEIYPDAAQRLLAPVEEAEPEPPRFLIDGARDDRLRAEGLWRQIRDLPLAEQREQLRRYLFASTEFFDLLREKSRLEGRKSRQRGVELAELALVSLEHSDEVFGERIHDLRALGWAWLGNAHRLALDFSAAAAAFEQADRVWSTARKKPDETVLALIFALKGCLRMVRREYAAATHDLDRACGLFRQANQASEEARALVKRATIRGCAGKPGEAIADLREASRLIDEDHEPELAFAIRANLANALARAGKTGRAAEELARARRLHESDADPLGALKLDCVAGLIAEQRGDLGAAKQHYSGALAAFRQAGELIYFGTVSVDLMLLHSARGEWGNISALAAEALPILKAMRLHDETVAAVKLLLEAIEAGNATRRLLKDLQAALQQDPLFILSEARA